MDNEANTDKLKGRLEQAAGDLTGDDDLKRRGKVDEAAGKAKSSIEKGVDWVKDKVKD